MEESGSFARGRVSIVPVTPTWRPLQHGLSGIGGLSAAVCWVAPPRPRACRAPGLGAGAPHPLQTPGEASLGPLASGRLVGSLARGAGRHRQSPAEGWVLGSRSQSGGSVGGVGRSGQGFWQTNAGSKAETSVLMTRNCWGVHGCDPPNPAARVWVGRVWTPALAWRERRGCQSRQLHFGHQQWGRHRSHEQESLRVGPSLTRRSCFHFKSFFLRLHIHGVQDPATTGSFPPAGEARSCRRGPAACVCDAGRHTAGGDLESCAVV